MSVGVHGLGAAGVAESGLDDFRVLACGDQQGCVGVAQVVEGDVGRDAVGVGACWRPDTGAPVVRAECGVLCRAEQQLLRADAEVGQMVGQFLKYEVG